MSSCLAVAGLGGEHLLGLVDAVVAYFYIKGLITFHFLALLHAGLGTLGLALNLARNIQPVHLAGQLQVRLLLVEFLLGLENSRLLVLYLLLGSDRRAVQE